MTPTSLKGGCRQLDDGKRCSREELALTDGFTNVLEGPSQGKYSGTGVWGSFAARIQFLPYIDSKSTCQSGL